MSIVGRHQRQHAEDREKRGDRIDRIRMKAVFRGWGFQRFQPQWSFF